MESTASERLALAVVEQAWRDAHGEVRRLRLLARAQCRAGHLDPWVERTALSLGAQGRVQRMLHGLSLTVCATLLS